MDVAEITVGLVYAVTQLNPKQLVLDSDPETFWGHLSEGMIRDAERHRDNTHGHRYRMAGIPGKVVAVPVPDPRGGRLKNGVRVEVEYGIARRTRHGQLELDDDGEMIFDVRTFEAVVRPSQLNRTWAEVELAAELAELDGKMVGEGQRRVVHWYDDCEARQPADALSDPQIHQPWTDLCPRCLEVNRARMVAARKKRKLRPGQARVLRHIDTLRDAGVFDDETAARVRDEHLFPGDHPSCRGAESMQYVLGWLDGRGLE
jgi:hypothetical protein